jgi:hypothetical protein
MNSAAKPNAFIVFFFTGPRGVDPPDINPRGAAVDFSHARAKLTTIERTTARGAYTGVRIPRAEA